MEIKTKTTPPSYIKQQHTRTDRPFLYEGPKSELQHTRNTLGTLSWVFKEDDYSIVVGNGSPCGRVSSH